MHRRAVLFSCVLMAGCHRPAYDGSRPPPSAYIHLKDGIAELLIDQGLLWPSPCTKTEKGSDNVVALTSVAAEQCYHMGPRQPMRGIWLFGTDGSWLCAPSAKHCSYESAPYTAEFETRLPEAFWREVCPGDLYAMDFVGRQTSYGHDLRRKAIVAVERIGSIKRIEAAQCEHADRT
jgi:hypothetical protein